MAKLAEEIKLTLNMEKIARGIIISNYFNWLTFGLLKYDKESKEILVNEDLLMTLIQLENPAQKDRKIKLLPQDEWLDVK